MLHTENRDHRRRGEHFGPNTAVAIFGIGLVLVAVAIGWQGHAFGTVDWIGVGRAMGAFVFGAAVIGLIGFYERLRAHERERMDQARDRLGEAARRADDAERRMYERKRRQER